MAVEIIEYRCLEEALAASGADPVNVCAVGNVLDPLSSRTRKLYAPGLTVRDYVCNLWPMLSPDLEVNVAVDGRYLGHDDWALSTIVRPAQSLTLAVAPRGGGGGKSIFATVAMLAVAVVAPYIAPEIVGAIGLTGLASSIATPLLTVGLILGGSLLISAFVGTGAHSSSSQESPTWSDAPNPVTEGGPWPIIYGTMRITPVTLSWNKVYDGEDQYLNWMGAIADHEVTSIDDIFVNGNPISFYDNVTVEKRLGTTDQEPIPFFTETISEKTVNMRMSTTFVTARTDGNTCQGLGFILCFTNGLAYISDSGTYKDASVKISLQYRKVGSTEWIPAFGSKTSEDKGEWAFETDYAVDDSVEYDGTTYYCTKAHTSTAQYITETSAFGIDVEVEKTFADDLAYWSTTFDAEEIYKTISDNTSSPLYKLFRVENVSEDGAQYDLRVKFAEEPNSSTRYLNACYFSGIQEIVYDAFSYPGRALLGVRIKANDLLNSSTSLTITCLVRRDTVQVYDGTSWSAKDASNPAWACWDLQHNTDYGGCTPAKRIVYDDFAAWAEWLETQSSYRVNICIDSISTHQEWMTQIAMLGRGSVVQIGSKFSCIVDKPESVPVCRFLFNVGNIRKDSFSEKFLSSDERANCIEVTYKDKESDYSEQTLAWYGEDYDTSPEQSKTTEVKLLGCTSTEQALMHAEYLLKKNRYLTNTVTFGANVDAVGCLPGDVVAVGHDVPQWGYGGRVVAATENSEYRDWTGESGSSWTASNDSGFVSVTATITVDRDLTLEPGERYALQVRLVDDRYLEYPVAGVAQTTTTNVLTIDGGWDRDGQPAHYDLYQFGPVNKVVKLFKILTITRTTDFTYSIEALEYNDGVYDDAVTVPEVINVSSLSGVHGLVAVENWTVSGGVGLAVVDLSWLGSAFSWSVSYRAAGEVVWKHLGTTRNQQYTVQQLTAGKTYMFRVASGNDAETVALTFSGRPAAPSLVSDVAAVTTTQGVQLSWTLAAAAWVTSYDIAVDGDVVEQGYAGSTYLTTGLPAGSHTVSVRGRDLWGQCGAWANATVTVAVPAVPIVLATVIGTAIRYDITPPTSDFSLTGYRVRMGTSWASAKQDGTISGTTITFPITGAGTVTRWFAAIDSAGNIGAPASASLDIAVPGTPTVTAAVAGSNILISWTHQPGTLPLASSAVYRGDTLATATLLSTGLTSTSTQVPGGSGTHRFWVVDTDSVGTDSAAGMAEIHISAPSMASIMSSIIDNNVLLTWSATAGTLPIADYELRKGTDYATSRVIGRLSGLFSTVFESVSGIYTYWITPRDVAGNDGTPTSTVATVSQPPDYVLYADIDSDFSGACTNAIVDDGVVYLPIDQTKSVSDKMTDGGWIARSEKIAAGYPYRLQPAERSGSYQEVIDYGATLAKVHIVVTSSIITIAGSVTTTCRIESGVDDGSGGITWTSLGDVWEAMGSNFRYVRVTIGAEQAGTTGFVKLAALNTRLDLKMQTDSGSAECLASDTDGTDVSFTTNFIDVHSITLTPQNNGDARFAIYDFVDDPNPTTFKILMYDVSGNRVSGTCSWTVRGV